LKRLDPPRQGRVELFGPEIEHRPNASFAAASNFP
jgi:hypothetical protein